MIRVDASSPVPPYEQLRARIAASIVGGHLAEGHQLPPIRQLAADLDLAPGTVARAYRELEAAGLVISRGRRGTRVAAVPAGRRDWDARLETAARRYAEVAHELGVEVDDALTAVHAALAGAEQGTAAGSAIS